MSLVLKAAENLTKTIYVTASQSARTSTLAAAQCPQALGAPTSQKARPVEGRRPLTGLRKTKPDV